MKTSDFEFPPLASFEITQQRVDCLNRVLSGKNITSAPWNVLAMERYVRGQQILFWRQEEEKKGWTTTSDYVANSMIVPSTPVSVMLGDASGEIPGLKSVKEHRDHLCTITQSFGEIANLLCPSTFYTKTDTHFDHTKTKDKVCFWLHGKSAR